MSECHQLSDKPVDQSESSKPTITDWTKCVLCQEKSQDRLTYPDERPTTASGYDTLAENILEFHNLGSVPLNIDITRLDKGTGISNTLRSNHAGWHKYCWLSFCRMKLLRAQKRSKKRKQESDDKENDGPVKTRSRLGIVHSIEATCFFCDESNDKEQLHLASTANIDATVRACAVQLGDSKILTKLAGGDMVAINARYHLSCLTRLRNRLRDCSTQLEKVRDVESADELVLREILCTIDEARNNPSIIPIFKLSELTKRYESRLAELESQHPESCRLNSTRLKERLISQRPDLRAEKSGHEVLLIFEEYVGSILKDTLEEDEDRNTALLAKAAKIVRTDIFNTRYEFSGSFEPGCEQKAVPPSLHALVGYILEGSHKENQQQINPSKDHIAVIISELLLFNANRKSQASTGIQHKDREAPLPLFVGAYLHSRTRSKELVNTFHRLGLSVSYDRVLSMSADLGNSVITHYESVGSVCPPNLKLGVFTTSAVDNIDHNPSATSSKGSFHGTGISLFQHPDSEDQGT